MISTHILDTTKGVPAKNVNVVLEKEETSGWQLIGKELTNADGRIAFNCPSVPGIYRLTFEVESYHQGDHFFLNTPVVFKIQDTSRKYHVPLLLNPYGYSTYRGS